MGAGGKGKRMANKATIERGEEMRNKIKEKIIEYMCEHGYSPSVREIGEMVGLKSSSSIHAHLMLMFEKGMLETDGEFGSPRAIRVPGYKFVKVEGEADGN